MRLYDKVRAIKKVYKELDEAINKFKDKSQLKCLDSCSECCRKDDIEATILEFLPMAYDHYIKGDFWDIISKLDEMPEEGICNIYAPMLTGINGGGCNNYLNRGLICRLFGFSAHVDKTGSKKLVTCKLMKEVYSTMYVKASEDINAKLKVPVMRDYYSKLYNIDPSLASKYYPINEAIKKSFEYVAFYYSYRKKRA